MAMACLSQSTALVYCPKTVAHSEEGKLDLVCPLVLTPHTLDLGRGQADVGKSVGSICLYFPVYHI